MISKRVMELVMAYEGSFMNLRSAHSISELMECMNEKEQRDFIILLMFGCVPNSEVFREIKGIFRAEGFSGD